ncbi:MAG: asparagine--tRNA ligase [Patescibacteria group bacterium]
MINEAKLKITPLPRSDFDIFSPSLTDHILTNKHLFLRNPKIISIIKLKSILFEIIRDYFRSQKFVEVNTPIITQSTLYEDDATFSVDYFGVKTYLSQCAGLYLGAAVPALEKVYTITPAFRAQPSRSPRHNPEFYHAKAQIAFCDLDEIMKFTENMIYYCGINFIKLGEEELKNLNIDLNITKIKPPYPKITYTEALKILKKRGVLLRWGKSLNEMSEKIIGEEFKKPVFITGMPRKVEPFPYALDPKNSKITMTADLLAPDGYGEILGVAEFIYNFNEILERFGETDKHKQNERFKWYIDLMQYGNVPHSGFGLGIERLLRWFIKLPHVRDAFAFPRLYHRFPYP